MITDKTLCVVETSFMHIFDFCIDRTPEEVMEKAVQSKMRDLNIYSSHMCHYPDRFDYWKSCFNRVEKYSYKVMTYAEFKAAERRKLLAGEPNEISEEHFYEQFNVLPPLRWCTFNNVEMFCMSEMWTGTYTTQYAHDLLTNKFYAKMVDCCDRDTWIDKYLRGTAIPF